MEYIVDEEDTDMEEVKQRTINIDEEPIDFGNYREDKRYLAVNYVECKEFDPLMYMDECCADFYNITNEPPPALLPDVVDPVERRPATKIRVLMYDMSVKNINEVNVGDKVMGPDSQPRTVISTSIGMGNIYEVCPNHGKPFLCGPDYILTLAGKNPSVTMAKHGKYEYPTVQYSIRGTATGKSFRSKEEAVAFKNSLPEGIFDISISEYLLLPKTYKRTCCYLLHQGLSFPEKEVPMDPWMLGYWIGDGESAAPNIITNDKEIVTEYEKKLPKYDNEIVHDKKYRYRIRGTGARFGNRGTNEFLNVLKRLELIKNKHIPEIYISNSREVRLGLLAGFIDADGSQDRNSIEISQKNIITTCGIISLAFSLGFMVTHKEEIQHWTMPDGEVRYSLLQNIRLIGDNLKDIPVVLDRKKCHDRKTLKRDTYIGFDIKQRSPDWYYDIQVDKDGRFMTEDYLVSHGTIS